MPRYTRRQLVVLLLLVAAAGVGLAVQRWRAAYPALAERLERFDHAPALTPADAPALPASAPGAPRRPPAPDPDATGDGAPPPGREALAGAPAPTRPRGAPRPTSPPRLDPNRATAEELVTLPGVGPVLAARIVAARERAGPFTSVEDLRRVRGVGPATLARLRPFLEVPESPPSSEGADRR